MDSKTDAILSIDDFIASARIAMEWKTDISMSHSQMGRLVELVDDQRRQLEQAQTALKDMLLLIEEHGKPLTAHASRIVRAREALKGGDE